MMFFEFNYTKTVCQFAVASIQLSLKFPTVFRQKLAKSSLWILLSLLLAFSASATNWYVRTSSFGGNSGMDWNNAWSPATINNSSLHPGDIVYLAGGVSANQMTISASGTAVNPIYFQRVLATDAAATNAAGWSPSFASQLVFKIAGSGQGDITLSSAKYVVLDGRYWQGIQCVMSNTTSDSFGVALESCASCTIANVESVGPQFNGLSGLTFNANVSGFIVNGGTNCLFTNCWAHGSTDCFFQYHNSGVIVDHCWLTDCGAPNGGAGGAHNDLIIIQSSSNLIIRNSVISNWNDICVEYWGDGAGACGATTFYGNVFINAVGVQDVLWPSGTGESAVGPLTFCNNTLYQVPVQMSGRANTLAWPSGSCASNNIFYGLKTRCWYNAPANEDYEFADSTSTGVAGTHSISNGSNPFVNVAAGNFNIVSNIGATYPRNRGVQINNVNGQTFNIDPNGNQRGADGAWDIGAYEYTATNATNSTGNAMISVSPATIDFGPVAANSSVTNSFTVQNIGGGTLTGTASVSAPFNIVSGGTYSLGANQTQQVVISYSPNGAPTNSAVVNFSNASGSGTNATVVGSIIMPTPSGFKITSL